MWALFPRSWNPLFSLCHSHSVFSSHCVTPSSTDGVGHVCSLEGLRCPQWAHQADSALNGGRRGRAFLLSICWWFYHLGMVSGCWKLVLLSGMATLLGVRWEWRKRAWDPGGKEQSALPSHSRVTSRSQECGQLPEDAGKVCGGTWGLQAKLIAQFC